MKREVICGIYKITSPTGKIYVGKGKDIYRRWTYYRSLRCEAQKKIYASLKKYGPENHVFEIIERCTCEDLDNREIYYIAFYNSHYSPVGLNLSDGGGGNTGYKCSEETKERIRKKNTGRIKSKEEIEKTRVQNIGQKRSRETKELQRQIKLSQRQEIANRSREVWARRSVDEKNKIIEKIAKLRRGKKMSIEAIKKTAEKNTGKKRTKDQCKKISDGKKGKKLTEDHKVALKEAWVERKKNYPLTEDSQLKSWLTNKRIMAQRAIDKFNESNKSCNGCGQ